MKTFRRLALGLLVVMATLAGISESARASPLVPGNAEMETWGAIDGYIYIDGDTAVIAPDGMAESWLMLTYSNAGLGTSVYQRPGPGGPHVPGQWDYLQITRDQSASRKAQFALGQGGRVHGLCLAKIGDMDLPPCDPGPSTHPISGGIYFDPILTR